MPNDTRCLCPARLLAIFAIGLFASQSRSPNSLTIIRSRFTPPAT